MVLNPVICWTCFLVSLKPLYTHNSHNVVNLLLIGAKILSYIFWILQIWTYRFYSIYLIQFYRIKKFCPLIKENEIDRFEEFKSNQIKIVVSDILVWEKWNMWRIDVLPIKMEFFLLFDNKLKFIEFTYLVLFNWIFYNFVPNNSFVLF